MRLGPATVLISTLLPLDAALTAMRSRGEPPMYELIPALDTGAGGHPRPAPVSSAGISSYIGGSPRDRIAVTVASRGGGVLISTVAGPSLTRRRSTPSNGTPRPRASPEIHRRADREPQAAPGTPHPLPVQTVIQQRVDDRVRGRA